MASESVKTLLFVKPGVPKEYILAKIKQIKLLTYTIGRLLIIG